MSTRGIFWTLIIVIMIACIILGLSAQYRPKPLPTVIATSTIALTATYQPEPPTKTAAPTETAVPATVASTSTVSPTRSVQPSRTLAPTATITAQPAPTRTLIPYDLSDSGGPGNNCLPGLYDPKCDLRRR